MRKREYDLWSVITAGDIDSELDKIETYLSSFDGHLAGLTSEHQERVAAYKAEKSGDDEGLYAEELHNESKLLHGFKQILQNSTLCSVVTFFELQAVKLARIDCLQRVRKEREDEDKPRLRHDELVAEAKKCIGRFENLPKYWSSFNLTFQSEEEWNEIERIGQVRNKIAHTNGELGDDNKSSSIRDYVKARYKKKKTSLRVEDDFLVVEPEYCIEAMEVYRAFLMKMVKATREFKLAALAK